jgi:hypothetical protein
MNAPDLLKQTAQTLLAKLFSHHDPETAQEAAAQAMEAYGKDQDPLLLARHIAFALATLSSLGQSMTEALPIPDALRLRTNAAACHRAAEQARNTLARAKPATVQAPQPTPQPTPEPADRSAWAEAIAKVAQEFATEATNLPPQPRQQASIKAQALATSAQNLLNGVNVEPYRLRT